MKTIILKLIRLYQKTLSPDTGWFKVYYPHGYCKFHPHCSEYGHQAIDKHGVLRGGTMTVWRILRCNPFTNGGHDPVK
ncbi:membrane protein insertion efficiency factor YidD [Candidatus Parcubacteria bacterium]|nr:MAG: membrane protein insertion efficiency factor YidD [Candidatus Parcubacteria bacterium]